MNKGISFHFGFIYKNIEDQVKAIKDAGFDCIMTNPDPTMEKENGTIKKQVKLFKKHDLKLSSLHSRYNRVELPHFWLDDKIGKRVEKNLVKDVKLAHKFGFTCVVAHMKGQTSELGMERLKRILKVCERLNVPLALENLSSNQKTLEDIFKNIQNDYLKFCWDVGHNHGFTPEIDFAEIYKDKLVAVHLHDNLGANVPDDKYNEIGYNVLYPAGEGRTYNPDMHTLNKYGNIDWKEVAKKLSNVKQEINLDYEVLMCYRKNETPNEVLKEVYDQACELESFINEYK